MPSLKDLSKPGNHETEITRMFRGRVRYDGDGPVFDKPLYLMGFYNRSGSNLLADYLRRTPYFRGFGEFLNYPVVAKKAEDQALESFPDYMRFMTGPSQNARPAFAAKASWDQIMMLLRFGIHRMYPEVRIIHITRGDLLGLAISYSIADQTKQWTSTQQSSLDGEPQFDPHRIGKLMEAAMFSDHAITLLANMNEIPRLPVTYEDLVADPRTMLARIGDFAGVDLASWEPPAPKIARQASALNEDFRDQYLAIARSQMGLG